MNGALLIFINHHRHNPKIAIEKENLGKRNMLSQCGFFSSPAFSYIILYRFKLTCFFHWAKLCIQYFVSWSEGQNKWINKEETLFFRVYDDGVSLHLYSHFLLCLQGFYILPQPFNKNTDILTLVRTTLYTHDCVFRYLRCVCVCVSVVCWKYFSESLWQTNERTYTIILLPLIRDLFA